MNNPNDMHSSGGRGSGDLGWAFVLVVVLLGAAVAIGLILGT